MKDKNNNILIKEFDECKTLLDYLNVFYVNKNKKVVKVQDLVNKLNYTLHCKIEMKEVGDRGFAKVIGGVGSCGRFLCCNSFLDKTRTVSLKLAKNQGLSFNMAKLTGACGKLRCCLRYERDCYTDGKLEVDSKKNSDSGDDYDFFEEKEK